MNNHEKSEKKIPAHVAFIMDGNGRWAQSRGLPRQQGHMEGVKTAERVIQYVYEHNIRCATFYTFSTENWSRPKPEVDTILSLLDGYLDRLYDEYMKSNGKYSHVEFRFIGDLSAFSDVIREKIDRLHRLAKKQDEIYTTINIAINYGGRSEIVSAVNRFISENPGKPITKADISDFAYTSGLPDPDLIIRTAGEFRLSNFLTWQSVYSEYYSTDILWPDFGVADIEKAFEAYGSRKRKFGSVTPK